MTMNMKNSSTKVGMIFITFFASSYLLNFFWESLHSVFLYEGHNFSSLKYILMILNVSAVDGLLVISMYLIVSLLWMNLFWIKNINIFKVLVFVTTGIIIAWFIEFRAVYLQHRWSYNELMPTIFGIGLSPLLQLSLTGIASLWLAKRLLYGRRYFNGR